MLLNRCVYNNTAAIAQLENVQHIPAGAKQLPNLPCHCLSLSLSLSSIAPYRSFRAKLTKGLHFLTWQMTSCRLSGPNVSSLDTSVSILTANCGREGAG